MTLSIKLIGVGIIIASLSFAWQSYLTHKYNSLPITEPISLSEQNKYSWSFSPTVAETYELVIRLYKNTPPPYDYVTEIINKSTYKNTPINVSWQLLNNNEVLSSGDASNYGLHFSATDKYIEKGIGSFSLNSDSVYNLKFTVLSGHNKFNILTPEVRITHNTATDDWLFGQALLSSFAIMLCFSIIILALSYLVINKLWRKHASS
jgi:hypothetical protein